MDEEQLAYLYPDMYGEDEHEDIVIMTNDPESHYEIIVH